MPSVTTIGDVAFGYCSALTSVDMPSVTTIGNSAFERCSALTSVEMPSVTTIGAYAFYECSSLTSISMPSVTTIGGYAFYYCNALTSVSMPSATTIGYGAFYYCFALTLIDIPASVSMIDDYAFTACSSLTSVYCHWEDPLECNPGFGYNVYENATLYVPTGTIDAYRSVFPWSEFLNIEEKDYSGIDDTPGSELSIKVIDGAIIIEGGDGTASAPVVEVYSAGGVCVYRLSRHRQQHRRPWSRCLCCQSRRHGAESGVVTSGMTACRVCGKRSGRWNGVVEAVASTTVF